VERRSFLALLGGSTLASGGWDDRTLAAQRFNHLGTFDESRMSGLLAAVEFQKALESDRIEARIRFLRRTLGEALRSIEGVRVVSPFEESMASGTVSFSVAGVDSLDLQRYLARTARVRTRVVGE
jgi:selenocysteine lyase/cysteine desulfurase